MDKTHIRLLRKDRPVDPEFRAEERLFRRCSVLEIENGKLAPSAVAFPDFSCNREKYCEPTDVLYPSWPDFGVVEFRVCDVPRSVPPEYCLNTKVTYSFGVEHVPEVENFAHSEVRLYKDWIFNRKNEPTSIIKKWFRGELSLRTKVILQPKR